MTTTEKASIGGYSFTLEKDAYEKLEKYLSDIGKAYKADPFSKEIISDIEVRIAELLSEKCGKDKVVNTTDVQEVCNRIGSPKDLEMEEKEAEAKTKDDTTPKRLFRDMDNRMLGGVCSGIAARLNIDTVFIRLAFAILFCLGFLSVGSMFGITTLAYIILWIIIPPARTVEEKCRMRGKPIELEQFKSSVKDFGEEAVSSPTLHTFGRVMATVTGVIMMVIGISGLLGSTVLTSMPQIVTKIVAETGPFNPDLGHLEYDMEYFSATLFAEDITWWIITAIAGLFSVWMLYNGVLLTFNFKAPKWKPGVVLFILWILSILVFAGFIINRLVNFTLTV